MIARPFLKWVGGKGRILSELRKFIPSSPSGRYFEPFIGGGSVFFDQVANGPGRAGYLLSDSNDRLIRTYAAIRDDVERVIRLLEPLTYDKATFEDFRAQDPDRMSDTETARWFIYLNKSCFNGLYRVNKSGRFNVPFGDYKNPTIFDPENLRACSRALRGVEIITSDFETVLDFHAKRGDVVYCDPPYVPISRTADFRSYAKEGFTMKDQERLRDTALDLARRGVTVVLSNSFAARPLFECSGFDIHEILAPRSVSCQGATRSKVGEIIAVARPWT